MVTKDQQTRPWRARFTVLCVVVFIASALGLQSSYAAGRVIPSNSQVSTSQLPTKVKPIATRWDPPAGISWQLQLTGTVNTATRVAVFDIDGFDNSAATVNKIHANGGRAICYVSGGSYENWRSDAKSFPAVVRGASNGWEGEAWLDIRRTDVLLPIMERRVKMCKQKGFDAVDYDNVDGYSNKTGFPLTAAHQLTYNKALANLAHKYGLAAVLKNDAEQATQLEPYFDAVVVEQCYEYDECDAYLPFSKADKPVFIVEYATNIQTVCADARAKQFSVLQKDLSLSTSTVKACPN